MKRNIPPLIALGSLLFCTTLFSQTQREEFIRRQSVKTRLSFKTWSFSSDSGLDRFTEAAFPFTFTQPFGKRLAFELFQTPYISNLQFTGSGDASLTYISDTYLRGSYIIGDHRALVTFGAGLPSGKTDLDDGELLLSGLAANRPLQNPVTNFGTGLNLSFAFALAHQLGQWVFGVGAGFTWRNEYTVSNGNQNVKVDPGEEINFTLGVDRGFADGKAKLITDLVYTLYSDDQLAGLPFFEAGDKFLARINFLFPLVIFDPVIIKVQNRFRLDNTSSNAALVDNGNELALGLTLTHKLSQKLRLQYLFDSKIYSDTVDQTEGALIFSIGIGVFYHITDWLSLDPVIVVHKGKINTGPGSDIDVTGLEFNSGFSGGLNFRF